MTSKSLLADPHRPRYHFLPPQNWLNDPNGVIQWKGRYHLFYQHNPFDACWGTMHWGHAVSDDLAHWHHRPIALSPTPGMADGDHVFSGCAVDDHGKPTLLYTGVSGQAQLPCLATALDDSLDSWEKFKGNPVIQNPPEGDVLGFRDHTVWQEPDGWHMGVGCGMRGVGGFVAHYHSDNLRRWHYLGALCTGIMDTTGEMWECPDFFELGDHHVLIISPIPFGKAIYSVGSYQHGKFIPTQWQTLDNGGSLYAPQSMVDSQNRRLMWGWLWETRPETQSRAAGWSGVMSLPRVLTLNDGELCQSPAPEMSLLHQANHTGPISQLGGDCLEIKATFNGREDICGLKVRKSPDGSEQTLITYNRTEKLLSINRTHSSLDTTVIADIRTSSLILLPGEKLKFHIFLDSSVIEVFANDRLAMATRIYPTRTDSFGLDIASGNLESLEVWEMESINI